MLPLIAADPSLRRMCNLYSELKSQEAVRRWARAMRDTTGNLPRLPNSTMIVER
jgi:hypothetical protein